MHEDESTVKVAVVGAGIAGLTTALQLAKRGYDVRIYEKSETIGGNLSSQRINGVDHDVYPHMFAGWYRNFWHLLESDLGLSQEGNFERRDGVKVLRLGQRDYIELPYPTTPRKIWEYLTSGFIPLPDMFVYGYSMIDLAAQNFEPDKLLSRYSLNGFLNSRGYATERAAEFLDLAVMVIWSIHTYQTSAMAYRDFVRRAFAFGTDQPFAWALRGSLWEKLIKPFVQKLDSYGCKIHTGYQVETIDIVDDKVKLGFRTPPPNGEPDEHPEAYDFLVLAVEPEALGRLIQAGEQGCRIVDRVPELSEVRRLRAEPIPVVDLYFKHELAGVPREHVGLAGSNMKLSCAQISGLWKDDPHMRGCTAVVLAASDFYALPIENPLVQQLEQAPLDGPANDAPPPPAIPLDEALLEQMREDGYRMIQAFHEYLPIFNPGASWRDPNSDIDWEKTHFRSNLGHKLFINEVGSGEWGPCASYQALPHVFFAGDFCRNQVKMATIEAAVLSGLEAAQALRSAHPMGSPIEILDYEMPSESALLAMKLALSANAYWARWFSLAYDAIEPVSRGDLSVLPGTAAKMLYLPYRFGGDVVQTAYELGRSLLKRPGPPDD